MICWAMHVALPSMPPDDRRSSAFDQEYQNLTLSRRQVAAMDRYINGKMADQPFRGSDKFGIGLVILARNGDAIQFGGISKIGGIHFPISPPWVLDDGTIMHRWSPPKRGRKSSSANQEYRGLTLTRRQIAALDRHLYHRSDDRRFKGEDNWWFGIAILGRKGDSVQFQQFSQPGGFEWFGPWPWVLEDGTITWSEPIRGRK